jgi:DNA polymerase bacteriophage-type
MRDCVIDFESYYSSDVSVTEQGLRNYVAKADAYVVAVTVGDDVHCGTVQEMLPLLSNLADDPEVQLWAANSNFDQAFFEKHTGKVARNPWQCILDLGSFNQCPRDLAGLAKTVLKVDMDKSTRDQMKGVHFEELNPAAQEKVQHYCMDDVVHARDILAELPRMTASEQAISEYTRMTNRRGICVDVDLVEEDKTRLEEMRFCALKAIPWHNDAAPLSYRQLQMWCSTQGLPCPKSTSKKDEECQELMSENPRLNEMLGTMRRLRQSNMMLKKLELMMKRIGDKNIMPLDLIYCGAPHTRRWSSQGFNIQNLDKEPVKVHNAANETVWTRNWLVPRPGKKFLILDFAQIEPRCLNWLAGNAPLLEAMHAGFSYYEAYASSARNWKGAAGSLKAEYGKQKYTLLKNECLGLGYGMGWEKFIAYNAQSGAVVTPEDAKKTVAMFRNSNKCVTDFWAMLDEHLTRGIRDKEKHLAIDLPNGEPIHYFNMARTAKGAIGFVIKGDRSHLSKSYLWGGVVTENLCQRMSRDLLATAIPKLELAGLPVIFSSHDEVIIEVEANTDKQKLEARANAHKILCTPPEWAEGLPLQVEGDFADSYCK